MSSLKNDPVLQTETTCGSLLYELKIIWDEVGESDSDRDKMLYELEQECLEVYRRKVDQANRCRAQLRQTIADCEAELATICSAMGERPVHIRQSDVNPGKLKEELATIVPQVEEMRKRKCERKNQFDDVLEQIRTISTEIYTPIEYRSTNFVVDESDISLRKLEELQRHLHSLHKEKSDRLTKVLEHLNTLNSLCLVLGLDFKDTVAEVHPSLGENEAAKNISNDTIAQLADSIQKHREVKIQRMQKLQDLATTMLELWNLMDTPIEEQQLFQNVTCNVAASEDEITEPNTLSLEFLSYVETEVSRLEALKSSKMKELVLKKRLELEEICRKTHMIAESDSPMEYIIEAIDSGVVDAGSVLEQIVLQIANVKEEAYSRKEILERVEKWLSACEEESWLEEYNRDDNRYNAGRGAHLTLKRAEKARALASKLPAMVEALAAKTIAWEKERGVDFLYDGIRVLSMLEEYAILRQEKEHEQKRQRDQKKLQGQLIAEQEALYGSKPSPSKPPSKKAPRMSTGGATNRRVSIGGAMHQTPKPESLYSARATPNTRKVKKSDRLHRIDQLNHHQDDGLSAGRRGLDISGLGVRKHAFNAVSGRDLDSPVKRKPFSPISSMVTSNRSTINNGNNNNFEDHGSTQNEPLQKPFSTTPSKIVSVAAHEENWTPKTMPLDVPTTPSTVTQPMQTGVTPGHHRFLVYGMQEEYSFEELRLAALMSKAN